MEKNKSKRLKRNTNILLPSSHKNMYIPFLKSYPNLLPISINFFYNLYHYQNTNNNLGHTIS